MTAKIHQDSQAIHSEVNPDNLVALGDLSLLCRPPAERRRR
jgi:hypothetical protein